MDGFHDGDKDVVGTRMDGKDDCEGSLVMDGMNDGPTETDGKGVVDGKDVGSTDTDGTIDGHIDVDGTADGTADIVSLKVPSVLFVPLSVLFPKASFPVSFNVSFAFIVTLV